jgi:phosphatidylglycerol:prolipoprotein diacylglycerol transferase
MMPFIHILGREIPSYGFFSVTGFVLSLIFIFFACRHFGLDRENAVYIYVLAALGGILGAKVLYLLTVLPSLAADLPLIFSAPQTFLNRYLYSGMVFYGGLIGGLLTAVLVSRSYHAKLSDYLPLFVPAVTLFFGFGRIGCFSVGCCYGAKTDSACSVVFTQSLIAPNGVPLIPVQLIEAGFDFLLFIFLLVVYRIKKEGQTMLFLYLILYSVFRFTIEFFRGDIARGILFGLSTSQWLSLAVFSGAVIWRIRCCRKVQA